MSEENKSKDFIQLVCLWNFKSEAQSAKRTPRVT